MSDDIKPELYSEKFKEPLQGFAVQLKNDNQQILQIAEWLIERDIPAVVSPASSNYAAVLRIELDFDVQIAWPGDYILVTGRRRAKVYHDRDFLSKFYSGPFSAPERQTLPIVELPEWSIWLEAQRNGNVGR